MREASIPVRPAARPPHRAGRLRALACALLLLRAPAALSAPLPAGPSQLVAQATRLELGMDVAPDPRRAMSLFCRAALEGSEPAATHIAAWLLDPDGASYDPSLAKAWLDLSQRTAARAAWRPPPPRCPSEPATGLPVAMTLLPGLVARAAALAGLDPALVKAVIEAESGFRSDAVSRRGAAGLMQLMPDVAASLGVADRFDVAENLRGGTTYLARLLARYGGDTALAVAAYNAGPGAVDRCRCVPDVDETRAYVGRVLAGYAGAAQAPPRDVPPPPGTRAGRASSVAAGAAALLPRP